MSALVSTWVEIVTIIQVLVAWCVGAIVIREIMALPWVSRHSGGWTLLCFALWPFIVAYTFWRIYKTRLQ